MKRFNLNFKLGETLLLIFELNMFVAGLVMLGTAIVPELGGLYRPAASLFGMLPALLTVGFACWLVYRMRCLRHARRRGWAVVGASGLALVAISFGAAVGNLNMLCMTDAVTGAVRSAMHNPVVQRASLPSLLTFIGIGMAFGTVFVMRAGKEPWAAKRPIVELQNRLDELSQRVVANWSDTTVARIDRLLEEGATKEAARLYEQTAVCSDEEASDVIADWSAHRLKLELDLISRSIQAGEATSRREPESTDTEDVSFSSNAHVEMEQTC